MMTSSPIDVGAIDRTAGSGAGAMRPVLAGLRHMVSSGHYLASHAAFEILEAGGNAVDAGVAAGITLAVVQSDFVNFAGVAPILFYEAGTGKVTSISGLGCWPKAATLEHFLHHYQERIPVGILRTVVPAAPDAWITALERFGTMGFGDVAAAATRLADEGFVMYPLMAEMIKTNEAAYGRWESSSNIYLPGGKPPRVGDVFQQRDLARTLRFMADEEASKAGEGRIAGLSAARDAFYRGDIAQVIVEYHRQHGGFLAMEDFADFAVEVEPAVSTTFGKAELFTCGFWCQGPTLLQMLNMVEAHGLEGLQHNSPEYVHLICEIIKLAFADRERFFGDPKFVDIPQARLMSKAYAAELVGSVLPDRVASDLLGSSSTPNEEVPEPTIPSLDTSYVCVVDRQGNAFSATPSDASNNTPVIPGTGLCPSSRGSQSWAREGHPAAIGPGRRPRLTPNPAIAVDRKHAVMPFGTPGGDVQGQAMLQAFLNVSMYGMDIQQAVEAPRFATYSFPSSFEPHEMKPNKLVVEEPLYEALGSALARKGHDLQVWPKNSWRAGGVCIVHHDLATGVKSGAADPRRPGYALGW